MGKDLQRFARALTRKDPSPALEALEEHPEWLLLPQTLLEACHHSHPQIVELTLDAGADADVRSLPTPGAWRLPIGRAVQAHDGQGRWTGPQRQVAELLRRSGADLEQRSCFGMHRPLGLAAEVGQLDAVTWLLGHGVELDFEETCVLGRIHEVRVALGVDPSLATRPRASGVKHFYTVLLPLDAVARCRLGANDPAYAPKLIEVAQVLIENGSPVGSFEYEGQRFHGPAPGAACAGNGDMLRLFLEHGASAQDCLGSALHGGRRELLDLLAEAGVDVDLPGDARLGNHLLHEMVRWGQLANALWLLDQGAPANPVDREGWTPFHYAARRGVSPKWAQALYERGVDPRRPASDGRRPVDIAREKKRQKLTDWLEAI